MHLVPSKTKTYFVNRPVDQVAAYLTELEAKRKFKSDIAGGLVGLAPPQFEFRIPHLAVQYIITRTLLKVELVQKGNGTSIITKVTPNIAYLTFFAIGVGYLIYSLFAIGAGHFFTRAGSGLFICLLSIALHVISKNVLLATFERCLRPLRNTSYSR